MADYWVSRDKYYCKYCKIYIADDKPSRLQHETGLRHKGNYERYIRDIYKRGARAEKDKVEEAREIARIDAAAKAAMGIQEEEEEPIASTSKLPPPAPTIAPKPSDPYANYSTAESLGYKDDVAEKKREEMDLRRKEGVIGEWQKVAPKKKLPTPAQVIPTGGILPVGVRPNTIKQEEGVGQGRVKTEEGEESKPKLSTESSEEQAEQKRKGYFTEKSYNPDEDDFDPTKIVPGGGSIKLKRKRLTLKEEEELEKKRKEREEAMVPIRGIDDVQRRGTGNGAGGGWASAEIEEEPMLEFGEQKPKLESEEDKKVDVKPTLDKAEGASGGGGTGFKKRKMHGAGTVRKK